jgi:hypothetical protein
MKDGRYESFEEFWPFYVGEHKDPRSRALHYAGTTMALTTVAAAALTLNPTWLLLTPVVGYTPAWIGHFIIEKNRPATFKYPVWSLRGDFKMLSLALAGKMGDELERYYPTASRTPAAGSETAKPGAAARVEAPSTNGAHVDTTPRAATA